MDVDEDLTTEGDYSKDVFRVDELVYEFEGQLGLG
jgi:hypothetical protein